MKKMWTVQDIVNAKACYTREQIEILWAGRKSLGLREILALDIPAQDRLWVCWNPKALTPKQRTKAINRIVRRAVETFALPEPSTARWARKWLDGIHAEAAEAARTAWDAWAVEAARTAAAARAAEADRQITDVLAVLDEEGTPS